MKILLPLCATLVTLSLVSGDQKFRPMEQDDHNHPADHNMTDMRNMTDMKGMPKKQRVHTLVDFGDMGAMMDITLGNSSVNQTVKLVLARLEEIDLLNHTVKRSENFHKLNASWSTMKESVIGDVSTMTTSLVTPLKVGPNGTAGTVDFNMTANVFQATGTVLYGNQSVPVQSGALKFSIQLGKWPFADPTNRLVFSVRLMARGKGGKDAGKAKKDKAKDVPRMDRLELGEGMFMDAPSMAVADGKVVNINATLNDTEGVEFIWSMPSYSSSLYYDPVVGSTDPVAVVAVDPAPASNSSSTDTKSGGASWIHTSASMVTVAVAAGFVVASFL